MKYFKNVLYEINEYDNRLQFYSLKRSNIKQKKNRDYVFILITVILKYLNQNDMQ